ncbi:hypothetical protein DENSPDRAFT_849910 [Dentipellis sp. KUC8613]|nr:hypothetical protein DENSPDRAFT_849910 [Dentipellis sp. KUC8613]
MVAHFCQLPDTLDTKQDINPTCTYRQVPDGSVPGQPSLPVTRSVDGPGVHHEKLSPISRLPTELLAHIFLFHAVQSHVFSPTQPPPTWIALSQVCQRWRYIALGYPQLWTHIVLSNKHWTTEMLSRSKPLPISINAAFSGRPLMHAIEDALKETPRAREICLSSVIIQRLVDQLRDMPAPHLESLSLTQSALACTLPDNMFRGEIPLLRSLKLAGVIMRWPSSLLRPTLTHLEIRATCPFDLPTMKDMLAALATMPNLQTLIFSYSLPSVHREQGRELPSTPSLSEHLLAMPALRTLRLSDTASQCSYFMSHISIPIDAELSVTCTHDPAFEPLQSVRAIEALLSQHLSHTRETGVQSKLAPFTQLAIGFDADVGVGLRAGYAAPGAPWTPRLDVSLQWPANASSVLYSELLISRICPLLQTGDVHSLSVEGNFLSYGAAWLSIFGGMKRVAELVVQDSAVSGFLEAFKHRPSEARENVFTLLELPGDEAVGVDVAGVLLFPSLRRVSLAKLDSVATLRLFRHLRDELAVRSDFDTEGGLEKLAGGSRTVA